MNAVKQTKLFQPENPYRMQGGSPPLPATATIGKNPPNGAVVYYSLKSKPANDVVLEFLDSSGKSIQKFTAKAPSAQPSPTAGASPGVQPSPSPYASPAPGTAQVTTPPEEPQAPSGEESESFGGLGRPPQLTTDVGLNRFIWN